MRLVYETERLILKALDESNAPILLDYYSRNKEFLRDFEPCRTDEFYTIKAQASMLRDDLSGIIRGNRLRLWIFKKEDGNFFKTIGTIAFTNILRGSLSSCLLGYKLDAKEVNKGFITEALQKGIDIMFNRYKLHRIEANIMPRNRASMKVVEKLGFHNEGLALKYLKINGEWEDHVHMALLNEAMD